MTKKISLHVGYEIINAWSKRFGEETSISFHERFFVFVLGDFGFG